MSSQQDRDLEEKNFSRFFGGWLSAVGPLVVMIFLCEKLSFLFYPFFLYFLGNRFFKLSTLGHEGLHYLICRHRGLNTFIGRYFCHFPCFISHSRYGNLHSLHHRFTGDPQKDPDYYIYKEFPETFRTWCLRILRDMLTLRILVEFFEYYTELPMRLKELLRQSPSGQQNLVLRSSDFFQYVIYWILIIGALFYLGYLKLFFIYWIFPAYLHFPIIQVVNGFQHGARPSQEPTRSQWDPPWIIDFFIPLNLNYHTEHHENPHIPYFNLPTYARLEKKSPHSPIPENSRSNLLKTFNELFPKASG